MILKYDLKMQFFPILVCKCNQSVKDVLMMNIQDNITINIIEIIKSNYE